MAALSAPISPQQTRSERPRVVSSMSYASTHSHRSSRSREEKKLELTESARDKRRLEGKSDPTKALSEAQPAAVALEDSNLENIRSMQHKDREGNLITDPDRSNPTRPRMERPLDTVRSFNAAAEGTTHRRASYQRPQSSFNAWDGQSRRNSYYAAPMNRPGPGPRPGPNGGYYNRHNSYGVRPDAYVEEGGQGQNWPNRPQHPRYQSAPFIYPHDSPNSTHSHQQSYETMTSGSDELSKSTNPSSQNSSFDQLHQMSQRKPEGEYGTNPYKSGGAIRNQYPPSAFPNGYNSKPNMPTEDYGIEFEAPAPPPPPKQFNMGIREMASPPVNGARLHKTNSSSRPEIQPKRQSWIKRTFSKRG